VPLTLWHEGIDGERGTEGETQRERGEGQREEVWGNVGSGLCLQ
jgi:hypothetical protein